ncbi:MAG: TIGR01440 family protein [Clostridiales bacterium]|nr:TIGR01440 family protein [Clostridiales bacterium]
MNIGEQTKQVIQELLERSHLAKGDILVVGCSSSEIAGGVIGKESNFELAQEVFHVIHEACKQRQLFLAAQCCEHLNRALIIEQDCARQYALDPVCAVPKPKAGGSFATCAWTAFEHPVTVEHIRAAAGLDIGGTLIGMHLKEVAVPVRLSLHQIGKAPIICALTRPKYIGGERTNYQ